MRRDYAKKLYKLEKRRMFQEWTDTKKYNDRMNRREEPVKGMSTHKTVLTYGSIALSILFLACGNLIPAIVFGLILFISIKYMR